MSNIHKSQTLYFKNAGSDKVYHAEIVEDGGKYLVNFAYGRRGGALATGSKTTSPVDLVKAEKTFEALLKGKMAKGYSPGEDGKPYQSTSNEDKVTGINPQLLNSIPLEVAGVLLVNNDYVLQEKWDGRRTMLKVEGGNVSGVNKKGLAIAVTLEIEKEAGKLGSCLIDGEFMGDFIVIFDVLEVSGQDIRQEPYSKRLSTLDSLIPEGNTVLRKVKTAFTTEEKRQLFKHLESSKKEGVTFKNKLAPFEAGRPASGGNQLKYKFYAENSFIVSKINTCRSVALQVYNEGTLTDVGNVTIPPNMGLPEIGDILEVVYLYAYKGGSIYQPKNPRVRTDADATDCQMSKLKFKSSLDE